MSQNAVLTQFLVSVPFYDIILTLLPPPPVLKINGFIVLQLGAVLQNLQSFPGRNVTFILGDFFCISRIHLGSFLYVYLQFFFIGLQFCFGSYFTFYGGSKVFLFFLLPLRPVLSGYRSSFFNWALVKCLLLWSLPSMITPVFLTSHPMSLLLKVFCYGTSPVFVYSTALDQ